MKKEKNDMANKICEQKLILGNSSSLKKKKKKKKKLRIEEKNIEISWMDGYPSVKFINIALNESQFYPDLLIDISLKRFLFFGLIGFYITR